MGSNLCCQPSNLEAPKHYNLAKKRQVLALDSVATCAQYHEKIAQVIKEFQALPLAEKTRDMKQVKDGARIAELAGGKRCIFDDYEILLKIGSSFDGRERLKLARHRVTSLLCVIKDIEKPVAEGVVLDTLKSRAKLDNEH